MEPEELAALQDRLRALPDPPGFLAALLAHAPFALQVFDADGRSLLTNRAFHELFGPPPPPEYTVLKDDRAQAMGLLPLIQRAFGGETVELPTGRWGPTGAGGGETRCAAVGAAFFPLLDCDGAVTHVAAVYRDETDTERTRRALEAERDQEHEAIRRHQELAEALQAQERQFTALFESALDGITVTDDQGRFLDANPAACAIFGTPREDLLGQCLLDFSPGARAFRGRWREFLAEGEQRGEVRIHRPDGAVRDLEYQSTARFLPERHLSIFRDITDRKEAEHRLRQSEANLAASQRIANLGSWEMDLTLSPAGESGLRWSDEVFRIFGYEPGAIEVTNENFFAHVPVEEHPRIREAVWRAIEEGTQYCLDHRIRRPDGAERIVREQSDVLYDSRTGVAVRMVGTILDITDQRLVEEALRETERNLRQIMDLIPYGVFCKDENGRLLFCNRRFSETAGIPRDELIGRHQFDWTADRAQAEQFLRDDLEVIRSGRPKLIPEERFTDSTGFTHVLRTTKVPFRPAGSETPAVLCISVEITELKAAEEELARSHSLLHAVLESSTAPIVSVDRDYRYTSFNRAHAEFVRQIFGVEVELGRSMLESLSPEQERRLRTQLDRALTGEAFSVESRFAEVGRDPLWLQIHYNPISAPGGAVTGVAVFVQDITAQRRAAEAIRDANVGLEQRVARRTAELEAVNRELESFAYTVSHDLRAPLRGIDGFARLLLDDYGERLDETGRAQVHRIRGATQRMGRLIDDLLAFSRLGRRGVRRLSVNVRRVVRQLVDELQAAEPAPRELHFELGELPDCRADPTLLRQVFANLLGNAVKFTRQCPAARIEIDSRLDGGERVWFVRDNGVGFDPAYADKVFGVFQRLHRMEEYEGTGVGLAIVHRIVELHGGRIWTESEPGAGAMFSFTLGEPVRDEEDPQAESMN